MGISMDAGLVGLVRGTHAKDSPSAKEWTGCLRVKEIDEDARQITAVASAEIVDRDNEVVAISALKAAIPAYMTNPVVLAGHKHTTPDGTSPVVGRVVKAWTAAKEMFVKIQFAPTALGEEYWLLYSGKFQRALSIGFRTTAQPRREVRDGKSVDVITALELYEISCVPVPANPAALSKSQQRKREWLEQKAEEARWKDDNLAEMLLDYEGKYAHLPYMKIEPDDFDDDDDDYDAPGDDLAALVKGGVR